MGYHEQYLHQHQMDRTRGMGGGPTHSMYPSYPANAMQGHASYQQARQDSLYGYGPPGVPSAHMHPSVSYGSPQLQQPRDTYGRVRQVVGYPGVGGAPIMQHMPMYGYSPQQQMAPMQVLQHRGMPAASGRQGMAGNSMRPNNSIRGAQLNSYSPSALSYSHAMTGMSMANYGQTTTTKIMGAGSSALAVRDKGDSGNSLGSRHQSAAPGLSNHEQKMLSVYSRHRGGNSYEPAPQVNFMSEGDRRIAEAVIRSGVGRDAIGNDNLEGESKVVDNFTREQYKRLMEYGPAEYAAIGKAPARALTDNLPKLPPAKKKDKVDNNAEMQSKLAFAAKAAETPGFQSVAQPDFSDLSMGMKRPSRQMTSLPYMESATSEPLKPFQINGIGNASNNGMSTPSNIGTSSYSNVGTPDSSKMGISPFSNAGMMNNNKTNRVAAPQNNGNNMEFNAIDSFDDSRRNGDGSKYQHGGSSLLTSNKGQPPARNHPAAMMAKQHDRGSTNYNDSGIFTQKNYLKKYRMELSQFDSRTHTFKKYDVPVFVLSVNPKIFFFQNLLSAEDSLFLIDEAHNHFQPSANGLQPDVAYIDFERNDDLRAIANKLASAAQMEAYTLETAVVERFKTGLRKPLYHSGSMYNKTLLVFLNEPGGGDYQFPALNFSIFPQRGSAICLNNSDSSGAKDGRVSYQSIAADGDKWALTCLFNQSHGY